MPMARAVTRGTSEKIVPALGPPVGTHCEHCGKQHHVGGPLWTAPMHDPEFIKELLASLHNGKGAELASAKRLIGMLTSVQVRHLTRSPQISLDLLTSLCLAHAHHNAPPLATCSPQRPSLGYVPTIRTGGAA